MEETDDDNRTQVPGSKRILSIEDPDYVHLPDAKRMKEMHRRGIYSYRGIMSIGHCFYKYSCVKGVFLIHVSYKILKVGLIVTLLYFK